MSRQPVRWQRSCSMRIDGTDGHEKGSFFFLQFCKSAFKKWACILPQNLHRKSEYQSSYRIFSSQTVKIEKYDHVFECAKTRLKMIQTQSTHEIQHI